MPWSPICSCFLYSIFVQNAKNFYFSQKCIIYTRNIFLSIWQFVTSHNYVIKISTSLFSLQYRTDHMAMVESCMEGRKSRLNIVAHVRYKWYDIQIQIFPDIHIYIFSAALGARSLIIIIINNKELSIGIPIYTHTEEQKREERESEGKLHGQLTVAHYFSHVLAIQVSASARFGKIRMGLQTQDEQTNQFEKTNFINQKLVISIDNRCLLFTNVIKLFTIIKYARVVFASENSREYTLPIESIFENKKDLNSIIKPKDAKDFRERMVYYVW